MAIRLVAERRQIDDAQAAMGEGDGPEPGLHRRFHPRGNTVLIAATQPQSSGHDAQR